MMIAVMLKIAMIITIKIQPLNWGFVGSEESPALGRNYE